MAAIALIIALCLGGGVSFAVENAVPGDALYTVKVDVNENVRAALSVSEEAEARWQAKAAARRLAEAKELSARGTLSADVAAELSAEFNEHAEAALNGAQTLASEGNSDASSDITTELEAVVSVYADLFARESGSGMPGKSTLVLPHILEKSGATVRESSSGHASSRAGGDMDTDGRADVYIAPSTVKSETSAHAEGGSSAETESNVKMEGSTKVDIGL